MKIPSVLNLSRVLITSMIIASMFASLAHAQTFTPPLSGYIHMPMGKSFTEKFSKKINDNVWKASHKEYHDSVFAPKYTSVSGGKLKLQIVENSAGTANAGQLETLRPYYYGTFTIKAKASAAGGVLSSMYLYSDAHPAWTNTNEQINMELSSTNPTKVSVSNAHSYDNENDDDEHFQSEIIDVKKIPGLKSYSNKKMNTYKIEWLPGVIRWYVNGKKIAEQTEAVPTTPMHFHLGTYFIKDWDDFVESEIQGSRTMLVDEIKYVADQKSHDALFQKNGIATTGDSNCAAHVSDALNVLKKGSRKDYDFVNTYLDLIECVEKGSVMWTWEKPRRHTAGRPDRDDEIDFASALVHEACHSYKFTSYFEENPDAWKVPEDPSEGKDEEVECLGMQVEFLQKIGENERADAYKEAVHTEWWKVDYKDMQY